MMHRKETSAVVLLYHTRSPLAALSGRAIIELATSRIKVWAFKLCAPPLLVGGGTHPAGLTKAIAGTAANKVRNRFLITHVCGREREREGKRWRRRGRTLYCSTVLLLYCCLYLA